MNYWTIIGIQDYVHKKTGKDSQILHLARPIDGEETNREVLKVFPSPGQIFDIDDQVDVRFNQSGYVESVTQVG